MQIHIDLGGCLRKERSTFFLGSYSCCCEQKAEMDARACGVRLKRSQYQECYRQEILPTSNPFQQKQLCYLAYLALKNKICTGIQQHLIFKV